MKAAFCVSVAFPARNYFFPTVLKNSDRAKGVLAAFAPVGSMKPISPPERLVCNVKSASFKPYIDADGRAVPGQSFLQWDETFPEGAGFTIYRMAPGSSSQPHEHTCHEQFYVIEGEATDNDGYTYKAGDFVLLKSGTQHFSTSETGATLVVFVRELEKNL
jgi:quercetin dioxygenase-like cupin family protein